MYLRTNKKGRRGREEPSLNSQSQEQRFDPTPLLEAEKEAEEGIESDMLSNLSNLNDSKNQ